MNAIKLSEAALWAKGQRLGNDVRFEGISHDTRSIVKGNLFVAIKGETVDGHDFLEEAKARGAVAAVISRDINTSLPLLKVEDTVKALGSIARHYRNQFTLQMAAVTGSCGKTTVKEMIASILQVAGPTLASGGNLNTEIGLPLTLIHLTPEHRYAVLEMGARKQGDIKTLMDIAAPNVTLITNAGVAHLEIFGSEQGIAQAKGEIFKYLTPHGTAVINADDPNASYWKGLLTTQKAMLFGLNSDLPLEVTCSDLKHTEEGSTFNIVSKLGVVPIKLNAAGNHNVSNALGAAGVAIAMGISLNDIATGLERFIPVSGRLQLKHGIGGSLILDDSYNANPVSVKAALKVLAKFPGDHIFVMGDMLELGPNTTELHAEMGREARALGIHTMLGVGHLTQHAIEAFGTHGNHYLDKNALIEALQPQLQEKTTVLVKGSRGMRMEDIVRSCLQEKTRENNLC